MRACIEVDRAGMLKDGLGVGGLGMSAGWFGGSALATIGSAFVFLVRRDSRKGVLALVFVSVALALAVLALQWNLLAVFGNGRMSGSAL